MTDQRVFTKAYEECWQRLDYIIAQHPSAARLYSFLAKEMKYNTGAVVCTRDLIAKSLGVSSRTITNWTNTLRESGALITIPVHGKVLAYCLNPNEVWKGVDEAKEYAAFHACVLVETDAEAYQAFRKRMMGIRSAEKGE